MNLTGYEYSGFKLFLRKGGVVPTLYKNISPPFRTKPDTNILVQYKNGEPIKCWAHDVPTDQTTVEDWDDWIQELGIFLLESDVFVKNLTEEDVFGIFL